MDEKRRDELNRLESLLEYRFDDLSLLDAALHHSSYVNENRQTGMLDNERMEFLGDAVVQIGVSEILYDRFPDHDEGKLSKLRSFLVTEQSLALVARAGSLGDFVLLGRGEDLSGGREKDSILANSFEAVLGAVFLDRGYEGIRELLESIFSPLLETLDDENNGHDYKSRLQERSHELFRALPFYRVTDTSGPDHERTFEVEVTLNADISASGSGKSKKEAEQQAAKAALEVIEERSATREP